MKHSVEIVAILFSILVATVIWELLIVPMRSLIALTIGVIFFLSYRSMVSAGREVTYVPPRLRVQMTLFACLVAVSALTTLLVGSVGDSVEFLAWNEIPLLSLLRLLLGAFLTLFSPGYMILSLMDRNGSLTRVEKLFLSIVVSLFALPFLSCLSFTLGSSIKQSGLPLAVFLNIILLFPYVLFTRKKSGVETEIRVDLNEKLILVSLLLLMSILMISKYSLNLTWDYGDLDQYFGFALSFTKDSFPLSPIGPGLNYPFWPFVFLAEYFVVSGVPYANAFQFISVPITFLPIISFYVMNKALFKESNHRQIPIIATTLGFFAGGLGWVGALNSIFGGQTVQSLFQLFTNTAATNSGYLVPSFYPEGIYPLYTYTLTSIFTLIWLIFSKRAAKIGNLRYVLVSVTIAIGYLAHIAEIVFFIIIFFASILTIKREDISSYRKHCLSIISGLMFVGLTDVVTGGSYYTLGDPATYYGFSLYSGALALAELAFVLSFAKGHPRTHRLGFGTSPIRTRTLRAVFSTFIMYAYGLCLVIWVEVVETYHSLPTAGHIVPWYAWPNRLGIVGLIALFGLIFLAYKNKSAKEYFSFFITFAVVSLIIGRILHAYPFYYEDRLTFFIMIPTAILASYTLLVGVRHIGKHLQENTGKIMCGLVISTVFVSGFLPYTLLSNEAMDLNYWSNGIGLSNSELDALNFLRLNVASNQSVLTLSARSNRLLNYAGLAPLQTYVNRNPQTILGPLFPEVALYSLFKSQVKYFYIASADEDVLQQNPDYSGFIRSYLMKYLRVAFRNGEVTVYEVPALSAPTDADTALVTPSPDTTHSWDSFNESYQKYCTACSIVTAGDVITLRTDNQSGGHSFELPTNIDPTEYPYTIIRWKTSGSDLYFNINASAGIYSIPLGSSATWRTTVLNLYRFYDRNKGVTVEPGGIITSILLYDYELNSEYSIDYVRFMGFPSDSFIDGYFFPLATLAVAQIEYSTVLENDPNKFQYSTLVLPHDLNLSTEAEQRDFQTYLQWVERGGRLVVLDSLGTYPSGAFAGELSIYLENVTSADGITSQTAQWNLHSNITVPVVRSNDTSAVTTANYTLTGKAVSSYAVSKKVGEGEISYLAVSPCFSALKNSTEDIRSGFFNGMGSLLNVVDLKLKKNLTRLTNYFRQFDYIAGSSSFTGAVSVDTDYVSFEKLNVSYIKVMHNNGTTEMMELNNSLIRSFEYDYQTEFRIDSSQIRLTGLEEIGRYMALEIIGDFQLTLRVPLNGYAIISISNGSSLMNATFQESIVQLNIRSNHSTFISVKSPTIIAGGDTFFYRARIFRSQYRMPLFYDDGSAPFELIGNMTLRIEYADYAISFMEGVAFEGVWFYPYPAEEEPSLTETDIPWIDVLISPLHLLLLTALSFIIAVHFSTRARKPAIISR